MIKKIKTIGKKLNRQLNLYIVSKNQQQIIEASKSNKLIYLKPVSPRPYGGSIEHYFHFVFNLLLPLTILFRQIPTDVVFVFKKFGVFADRLTKLFPGRIRIEEESNIPSEAKQFKLIGMNPKGVYISPQRMENFKQDIRDSVGVTPANAHNILLIERVVADKFFDEKAKVKGGGSARRSILNHNDLKASLESMIKEPYVLHNLQLEKISFKEQIDYFSQAKIVIAQHGAGLANCIWMNPESIVIELSSEPHKNAFAILSRRKKHSYHLYKLASTHCDVDLNHFTNWLLANPQFEDIFDRPSDN